MIIFKDLMIRQYTVLYWLKASIYSIGTYVIGLIEGSASEYHTQKGTTNYVFARSTIIWEIFTLGQCWIMELLSSMFFV